MNNNRLMIRLIDVALIILLGFIAISRLKTEYVDLPAPGDAEPPRMRMHMADLHVYRARYVLVDGRRKKQVRDLDSLERLLQRTKTVYRQKGAKLVMNIQPHRSSIMQDLIDVLDVCQRNRIEKNLNYDRIN
ncbi:MAG: biopolymer transporter ExbD [candidate division KSB1 bacterium]|nr:biopolymer transporter ExbD [candidate division KSB1 bacterium]MDQ7064359.1 biopolymer transporter ExbD [candidate division KSB1 bacterium]